MRRILHTLRVRYALDMIYTYSGGILIAVGSPISVTVHCNVANSKQRCNDQHHRLAAETTAYSQYNTK